ncbi:hypothetical protein EW145_g2492 [Phellinidium pouzarii]|uniref:Uncharacterized protein n=1 Tax=Phellinidium pouzarii TaxID=167371 RepID=A0A4S4LAM9_9AGAM|nr:hypothetical protein EW145_g2492 [Phellinidium pouzarii]
MSSQQPNISPLSPENTSSNSNVVDVLKIAFATIFAAFSYLVHLPRIAYLPIRHAFQLTSYSLRLFLWPLQSVLAPIWLAVKIILTFVVVPLTLVREFAVMLYPLYVFLGAACVCGTLAGISARMLSKKIVDGVSGIKASSRLGEKGEKDVGIEQSHGKKRKGHL